MLRKHFLNSFLVGTHYSLWTYFHHIHWLIFFLLVLRVHDGESTLWLGDYFWSWGHDFFILKYFRNAGGFLFWWFVVFILLFYILFFNWIWNLSIYDRCGRFWDDFEFLSILWKRGFNEFYVWIVINYWLCLNIFNLFFNFMDFLMWIILMSVIGDNLSSYPSSFCKLSLTIIDRFLSHWGFYILLIWCWWWF